MSETKRDHIINVIMSCKTHEQLDNAVKWAEKVCNNEPTQYWLWGLHRHKTNQLPPKAI